MQIPPVLAIIADTLLMRPVDVPAPWYDVASGVLSVVVTLLLLGIAVALLGMARALKGAERSVGGRLQGLADELVPLARNLNQIATQLSEVTTSARGDLRKLSGTIGAVDDAVRDAIDAGEARLHQFGIMLDVVQDETQATVASATGMVRGLRTGAGALVSNLFRRASAPVPHDGHARRARNGDSPPLTDADVYARIAALEAALAALEDGDADDAEENIGAGSRDARASVPRVDDDDDDEWDDDDLIDDDEDEDDLADDEEDEDDDDDDIDDDIDDELDDDDDDDDELADDDDSESDAQRDVIITRRTDAPRSGGPQLRRRGDA